MVDRVPVARAWVVRRFGAAVIDLFLAIILLQVIAAIGFALTNGKIQAMNGITFELCRAEKVIPPELRIPQNFRVDGLTRCTKRLIIFPVASFIAASEITRSGDLTTSRSFTWPLDDQGRPIKAFQLDLLTIPLFVLLRLIFDLNARSPGRRICGQWLMPGADTADVDGPATRRRFLHRYMLFLLPYIPIIFALYAFPHIWNLAEGYGLALTSFFSALTILPVANAGFSILLKRDAFYDQFAGTHVVKG